MKKLILTIFLVLLGLGFFSLTNGQMAKINFFYSPVCPHCAQAKEFLNQLQEKYAEVVINRFNTFEKENITKLQKLYQDYQVAEADKGLVPIIFTNDHYFLGFDEQIGQQIEQCTESCLMGTSTDISKNGLISLPLIGQINPEKYSLPALAVILGFFDGFNVCSLGALVLILGLVLALKERKKILLFGGLFILTTALIYGFLIVLWYQVFAFFANYLEAMRILIGVLGIGGGAYFLKEFWRMKKQGAVCGAGAGKGFISKFSSKLQKSFEQSGSLLMILLSVLLFSAMITIVEFPCSAAVPVFFAGMLAESGLTGFWYLFYIALFVLFYMLDEVLVFLIAVWTMSIRLSSPKITTWITLIEAIVLLALGLYYLI